MEQSTNASPEAARPAASPRNPPRRRGRPAAPRAGADPADADIDANRLAEAVIRERDDGWTPARMRIFLDRLSETGNVGQCCRELDLSRQSAYALRRRNELFARAWAGASTRSRESLYDSAWQRAYHGVAEEVVIDGKLTERQSRPDGAMLRYLLTRADRKADDPALSALPARRAEFHLEELIDCLDPNGAGAHCPNAAELLQVIKGERPFNSGYAPAPPGFASIEEAIEHLACYRRNLATPPDEIDTGDLDPARIEDWNDDQWQRAERSGFLKEIGFYDRQDDDDPGDDEAADPMSNLST